MELLKEQKFKIVKGIPQLHLIHRGKTETRKKKSAIPILRAHLTLEEVISMMA